MAPKEINISSSLNCLFSDEEIDSIDESLVSILSNQVIKR